MLYEFEKLAQTVLVWRVWWAITILSTVYLFFPFIKVMGLWEYDWCFLHLEQTELFEGGWELLQTKRKQNRKKGIYENSASRKMEHTRVWETLEMIMMYICRQIGCWQDRKTLSGPFREAVWSLLQHRKLSRCCSQVKPSGRAHLQERSG